EKDDGAAERPDADDATGSAIERAADDGVDGGLPVGVGDERLTFKYRAMRSLFRGSIRTAHRPTVTGITNVPKTGPVIIASNQRSFADSVYLSALSPRRVSCLAHAEDFERRNVTTPLFGGFMPAGGAFPVERGSAGAAMRALETGEEVLRSRGVFRSYPQGTPSRVGKIGEGKTGV